VSAMLDAQPMLVNASRFRAAHEGEWYRLDEMLTRIEKRSLNRLDDDELLALPLLYRTTLSTLSVARETSLDQALVSYLEQLCTRAYFQIYGVPTSAWRQLREFLVHGWPLAVRSLWRETLASLLLLVVGSIAGFLLVRGDASLYYSLMPGGLAGGRGPSSSFADLRRSIYGPLPKGVDQSGLTFFASQLFVHNASISIAAFAFGFMFCLPTIWLIVTTGLSAGALVEVFVSKGLGVGILGWLSIHGTTELFAIVLSGAAGFRIGLAVAFPGRLARLDAAVAAGRSAAVVMGGTVIMLVFAGLLEGIGRETITGDVPRYAIGAAMLLGWLTYFYLPRSDANAVS